MDLPKPTAPVGTRTDYSVAPLGLLGLCHTAPDGVGLGFGGVDPRALFIPRAQVTPP
jgi:hypothetical protein